MSADDAPAKPKIACVPNGPYYLLYDLDPTPVPYLRRWNGQACTNVKGAALCRCGGSKNKPFWDGTHSINGFSDKKLTDGSANERVDYPGRGITIHDNRGICSHAGFCTEHHHRESEAADQPQGRRASSRARAAVPEWQLFLVTLRPVSAIIQQTLAAPPQPRSLSGREICRSARRDGG